MIGQRNVNIGAVVTSARAVLGNGGSDSVSAVEMLGIFAASDNIVARNKEERVTDLTVRKGSINR